MYRDQWLHGVCDSFGWSNGQVELQQLGHDRRNLQIMAATEAGKKEEKKSTMKQTYLLTEVMTTAPSYTHTF